MLHSLSYYYSKDILGELRAEAPDNGSPMWPPLAFLIWDLKDNFKAGDKRKVVWPCVLRGITPGESDRKRALVAWDKEVIAKLKATQRVPATTASVVELKEWNMECESVAFNALDSTMRAQPFSYGREGTLGQAEPLVRVAGKSAGPRCQGNYSGVSIQAMCV